MSDCRGTSPPSSGNGGSSGVIQTCPYAGGSEILLVDEIGLPLANTVVTVLPASGGSFAATTDATGKICLSLPPGTAVQIEIANIHETAAGDSTTTGSGRHFAAGGTGP